MQQSVERSPHPSRETSSRKFLRIPPFPGARVSSFAPGSPQACDAKELLAEISRSRVGGTYWGLQPQLPKGAVVATCAEVLGSIRRWKPDAPVILWSGERALGRGAGVQGIAGDCDPWHVLQDAAALVAAEDDERHLVAKLLNVPSYFVDGSSNELRPQKRDAEGLLEAAGALQNSIDPFTGQTMSPVETARLCGFWRRLIDGNRDIVGGVGFAFWKRAHIEPLLWNGSEPFAFLRNVEGGSERGSIAVWRSRAPDAVINALVQEGVPLIEVEDGFLRSSGLGADCVPPLSITVDRLGPHFDPSRPSELEQLIQFGRFDPALLARARELRLAIVAAGLGKYGKGVEAVPRPAGDRRHILVPGQVEDDRAVQSGGCGLVSNLDLLRQVRGRNPDAYIIYKPHPDVVAGHRRGMVTERDCLSWADEIATDGSIASLTEMVDELHVNTSLAGFEALLRGKPVTTYGVPFYAGWGLTNDLGPVPERRTARPTLDEFVAATLLLYPRYIDPVTGLPCPAEVVVARLTVSGSANANVLVAARRLQGKLMRRLRSLVQ